MESILNRVVFNVTLYKKQQRNSKTVLSGVVNATFQQYNIFFVILLNYHDLHGPTISWAVSVQLNQVQWALWAATKN